MNETGGPKLPPIGELLERAVGSDASDEFPDRIPGFEIVELIGEGGMGRVYRARQESLDRDVAIKILRPAAIGPEMRERFETEARSMAALQHPNIVTVFDFGVTEEGDFHLVMELIEGSDLAEVMSGEALPPDESLRIARDLCSALACAHRNGIVHRDIKPSNVLFSKDGRVKLTDFGLSKLFDSEQAIALTRSGTTVGTPEYMAPEQLADAGASDPRADLFSFGVLLFEMFSGRPLSERSKPQAGEPGGLPPKLDRIVKRATEPEPSERYQSAEELGEDLDRFERNRKRPVRLWTAFGVAVIAVFCLAIPWLFPEGPRSLPSGEETILTPPPLSDFRSENEALADFTSSMENHLGAVGDDFAFCLALPSLKLNEHLPPVEIGYRPEILRYFFHENEKGQDRLHSAILWRRDPRDWRVAQFFQKDETDAEAIGLLEDDWFVIDWPPPFLSRGFAIWTKGHDRWTQSAPFTDPSINPSKGRNGLWIVRTARAAVSGSPTTLQHLPFGTPEPIHKRLIGGGKIVGETMEEQANKLIEQANTNDARPISFFQAGPPGSIKGLLIRSYVSSEGNHFESMAHVSSNLEDLHARSLAMIAEGWTLIDISRIGEVSKFELLLLWERKRTEATAADDRPSES